jgi:hypothetical protein
MELKDTEPKKRGPKTGARGRPVNPERLRKIVKMRDVFKWPFSKIAKHLGDDPPMTEQAIYLAYNRWSDWVRENTKPSVANSSTRKADL